MSDTKIAAATHIGIDRYPSGHSLRCCVNDAKAMKKIFGGHLIMDKQATRANILEAVKETVMAPGPNEWGVITYSGHGTQMLDDNADEKDKFDEAVVTVELDAIRDDVIQATLRGRDRKGRILLISDSCFSGTISRVCPFISSFNTVQLKREGIRYLPAANLRIRENRQVENLGPQKSLPNVVVVSGCADFELSYEGDKHGVLTGAIAKCYKPGLTFEQIAKDVLEIVNKSPYPQHPQLQASARAKKWLVPEK